jgi:hypothetical protein
MPAKAKKSDDYKELNEGPNMGEGTDPKCSSNAPLSSYMYEFSGATCKQKVLDYITKPGTPPEEIDRNADGRITWAEGKFSQLENGDGFMKNGYPRTWFPIMRCFWHSVDPDANSQTDTTQDIFNLAIDGNFFLSGPSWEYIAQANNPNIKN